MLRPYALLAAAAAALAIAAVVLAHHGATPEAVQTANVLDTGAQPPDSAYENGCITLQDPTGTLARGYGNVPPKLPKDDVNNNGAVNAQDVSIILHHVNYCLPGCPGDCTWIGVNRYQLAGRSGFLHDCQQTDAQTDLQFRTLHRQGIDVVRFFAPPSVATLDNGTRSWAALDQVFASALANGIQLVVALEDHWNDCSGSGPDEWPCSWYTSGYKSPYNGYSVGFDDWASEVAGRYAGHRALKVWDVTNEPWGDCNDGNGNTMYTFFTDIVGRINAADSVTPISLGGSSEGWSYATAKNTPYLDFITSHDYDLPKQAWPADIAQDFDEAESVSKPFFVGEAGVDCYHDGGEDDNGLQSTDDADLCDPCDGTLRLQYTKDKIVEAFDRGAVGYLLWAYDQTHEAAVDDYTGLAGTCGYDFGPDDPGESGDTTSPIWPMLQDIRRMPTPTPTRTPTAAPTATPTP